MIVRLCYQMFISRCRGSCTVFWIKVGNERERVGVAFSRILFICEFSRTEDRFQAGTGIIYLLIIFSNLWLKHNVCFEKKKINCMFSIFHIRYFQRKNRIFFKSTCTKRWIAQNIYGIFRILLLEFIDIFLCKYHGINLHANIKEDCKRAKK